jgi:hypothetical protein
MVAVCCHTARRDEDLNATLYTIYRSFGDVRPASEIAELLTKAETANGST